MQAVHPASASTVVFVFLCESAKILYMQVFGAIEGDVDATHRIMHNALSGYADARLWRLHSLDGYTPPSGKQVEPELAKEFGAWRCMNPSCDGSSCTLWHDERELRFAKVRALLLALQV